MSPTKHLLNLRPRISLLALFATLFVTQASTRTAFASDQVLDWIAIANDTAISTNTGPLVTARIFAQLSASVYDAVNGIDQRFQPLLVKTGAPHHASARAAAVQAAYIILVRNYPSLTTSLTAQRNASIAALSPPENPNYVLAGISWGQSVADTVWTIRSADGFSPPPPPFVGALGIVGPSAIGVWRPTPLGNAPGAGVQFASMTPWVLRRPSQFRPAPPNALTSAEYATDYNEIKIMGSYNGSGRSADQSELVLFWAGNTALYWNRIASQISTSRSLSLTDNAHLFALLNVAINDAVIACWDAKYRYVYWRPVTAIRAGDTDGNPSTDVDPAWTPWLDFFPAGTPPHPEYPSGHSTASGAAAAILAAEFGNATPFTVTSDVRPGTRAFPSFSAAVAEIADARVFGGIHFRVSCIRGNQIGQAVAGYVLSHAMRARDEDEQH